MPHERDEEMRTHLQAWQSSGLTQKQYCQQHNLKTHMFSYYKAKFLRQSDELPKSEQVCGCGHALHEIGEDTSEQPDIIPAQIKVIEHIRVKYACRQCDHGIKTAPEPAQPIEKSIASPGLLAHIAVARYTDALPLYRQEAIFKRLNIDINRTSMANRMIKTAQLSQPLLQRLIHYQLQQSIIQADETPVQVLNEPGRKAQSQSCMWLYQSGSSGASPPVIIYDYQPGRSGLFAKNYLQDFKGQYLQTDGYSGYAQVCTPQSGIVSVGCRAHARHKFDEVIKALKGKNVKPGKAHMALNTIAKLYAIEKQCKTMSAEQRYLVRQKKSQPILSLIETAKANKPEPFAYIRYILTELPRLGRHAEPEEFDALLPWLCAEKIQALQ